MVDKFVKLYTELAKFPSPLRAVCRANGRAGVEVISQWEQRDLKRMEKIVFQKSTIVDAISLAPIHATMPVELHKEQLRAYSQDGLLTAVLRKLTDKQGNDKQYLEIWKGSRKLKSIDVLAQEKHLQIYSDAHFGSLHWSPTNSHLLYTAEKYFKGESYFKEDKIASATVDATESKEKPNVNKGEEYLYRQSWGEQLNEIRFPRIFTLNIETELIEEVPDLPESVSCSEAIWTPDGKGIVFVGLNHLPYKLGAIFCANRQSSIFHVDLDSKKCSIIGSSEHSVTFPRFSPNGATLVFLQSEAGGPHRGVQALMKCDWNSKTVSTLVAGVAHPTAENDFPGIYELSLPARIWSRDSTHILIDSYWRSRQELLSVNAESGKVTRLTNDAGIGQWTLLDVFDDIVVAAASSPINRPHLAIGRLVPGEISPSVKWIKLDDEEESGDLDTAYQTLNLTPTPAMVNSKFPNVDFDAILIYPKEISAKPFPLIVFPHGGPHSVFCASYFLSVEFYTRLGFATLMVNYRGSIGFGQDSVNSLLGNVGTQDVQDCNLAVEAALATGLVDSERMVLSGGSHGGFLVLQLAGQYPDMYKACIARNPVVNIGDMVVLSDIPDWSFVEAGLPFDFTSFAKPDAYKIMWERSPISHVDKIKIPTLFMLGSNDMRVPKHQGLFMHRALKARNIDTRVYMYDDCHGLSKIQSESDGLVNMAQWLTSNI